MGGSSSRPRHRLGYHALSGLRRRSVVDLVSIAMRGADAPPTTVSLTLPGARLWNGMKGISLIALDVISNGEELKSLSAPVVTAINRALSYVFEKLTSAVDRVERSTSSHSFSAGRVQAAFDQLRPKRMNGNAPDLAIASRC